MNPNDFHDLRVLAEQILTDLKSAEVRLTDPGSSRIDSRQIAQELDARINDLIASVDDQLNEEA